uniref:Seroin transcript 2B n=1 Tax=Mamestra brassicae TaxID=55057 RepID=A0A455LAU9_MAMBR|nr:seroin transcript 2B [Mamestra brassicae]
MMKILFVVMLSLAWSYGVPNSEGGGAFAFVDSSGNRYGGTYGLKDGKVVSRTGDPFPQHFAENIPYPNFANNIPYQNFGDNIPYQNFADTVYPLEEDFGQAYFSNLENLLQEYPAFPSFPTFTMPRPMNFGNSAYASAAAGPGYQHHVASINPSNPANPNVDRTINHFSDTSAPRSGFYSVSSNSYSSSSNVNGKELNNRGAETVVNDNGKVTHYKVQS